jgi:hypothetical protein
MHTFSLQLTTQKAVLKYRNVASYLLGHAALMFMIASWLCIGEGKIDGKARISKEYSQDSLIWTKMNHFFGFG